MKQELIFLPVVAMGLLTASVWVRLYIVRLGEMRAQRIRPQDLASRANASLLKQTAPADNFMNLFELPVLFYTLAVVLYVLNFVDPVYVWLAGLFVALRYVHSIIHITYNKVVHRFFAYALGGAVLWIMWCRFAFQLVGRLSA
jgi:hypothetical protein